MSFLSRLPPLPSYAMELVEATENAGGALLVFDGSDRIVAANREQRRIMPCCAYADEDTYSSLFWGAFRAGLTGNKTVKDNPKNWLENTIAARQSSPNSDFVNCYPWGRMLVSHLRLDDGTSIQARLDMRKSGIDRYFGGRDTGLGVLWAIRVQREILGLQAALDNLSLGVALAEDGGRLIHQNASFSDLLLGGNGLAVDQDGRLTAIDEYDQMSLSQALERAEDGEVRTSYVPIRRPLKEPLILAVSAGEAPGTAVVATAQFCEDAHEVASTLMKAFGLPFVQAEVLAALGAGMTVEEIALRRGVAKGTTYLQVKHIKRSLEEFGFAVSDLAGLSGLVAKIAAITRAPRTRGLKQRR